jgi:hypothetical protein
VLAQELEDFAERWVVNSWDAGLMTSEQWHVEFSPRVALRFEQMLRDATTVEILYSPEEQRIML